MQGHSIVRYCFSYLILFALSTTASAEGLLGGNMQQYATIWAQPQTASFSRFLYRTSTSIRYDLNIVLSFEQNMEQDFRVTLRDAAENNSLPNAAIMPLPMLLEMKDELPIAAFPLNFLPENINPDILESSIVDGEILGLPFHDGNHHLLYYNKLLTSGPVTDLNSLLSFHKTKVDPAVDTIVWDYSRLDVLCEIFPCTKSVRPSSDVLSNSLKIINKLAEQEVLSMQCPTNCTETRCHYLCMIESFYNGEVAYMINGDWELSEALHHLGSNLGIAPIPHLANTETKHYRYPNMLVYFDNAFDTGKKNTSLKLAYYLLNKVVQKRMFSDTNRIPVNEEYLLTLYEQLIPNTIEADNIAIMNELTTPLLSDNPSSRLHNNQTEFLLKLFMGRQLPATDETATRILKTIN